MTVMIFCLIKKQSQKLFVLLRLLLTLRNNINKETPKAKVKKACNHWESNPGHLA